MLSERTVEIVKATAPVVAQHAEAITRRFYTLMFEGDPEVKQFFNAAHQHSGTQQRALAGAICAYAANIDNLGALGSAVELIAQKHCSLGIHAEHYPIVGKHLLVAIKDVLGDGVTDEIIAAWGEAYGFLAKIFIDREAAIYRDQAAQPGGWNGYRPFRVVRKVPESEVVTSFYLKPADGKPIPEFHPGQYITVRVDHPQTPTSPRNYSLSDRPGRDYYRISVKREPGSPPGVISNYLHNHVNVGDELQIGPPCGEFTLADDPLGDEPVVLLSGGVGVTPVLSMLHLLAEANPDRPIWFVHAALNGKTHAFHGELQEVMTRAKRLKKHIRYSEPQSDDHHHDSTGYVDRALFEDLGLPREARYYICGPTPFMKQVLSQLRSHGVTEDRIHYEFFGPRQALELPEAVAAGT